MNVGYTTQTGFYLLQIHDSVRGISETFTGACPDFLTVVALRYTDLLYLKY